MSDPQAELESSTTPQPTAASSAPASPARSRWNVLWREWFRPLMLIALVMFSFRSAVADWNDVPTGSMKPTILEGDRIFINKVAYDLKFPFTTWRLAEWSDPSWGDIVVLRSPEDGKRLVKRVVALPGDVVEWRHGRLYLNGEAARYLELPGEVAAEIGHDLRTTFLFATEKVADRAHLVMMGSPTKPFGPYRVPEGHFFVMGDNRSNSRDSRVFFAVHRSAILGRATAVALSVDFEDPFIPFIPFIPSLRLDRFFSPLE